MTQRCRHCLGLQDYLSGAEELQLGTSKMVGRAMSPSGNHPKDHQVKQNTVTHNKDACPPARHIHSECLWSHSDGDLVKARCLSGTYSQT